MIPEIFVEKNNPMYGKKHSKDTIKKMKDKKIGSNNPMYGRHHSEETKEKMRKKIPWNKGKLLSIEHKKKIGQKSKGRIKSVNTRKKLSDSNKLRVKLGIHNFWKGGLSFEPYSIDWTQTLRRSIRERDHYTCQLCYKQQGNIAHSVHHIDYDKKNLNPDNLITICKSCHGKTNFNRELWIIYFNIFLKL